MVVGGPGTKQEVIHQHLGGEVKGLVGQENSKQQLKPKRQKEHCTSDAQTTRIYKKEMNECLSDGSNA